MFKSQSWDQSCLRWPCYVMLGVRVENQEISPRLASQLWKLQCRGFRNRGLQPWLKQGSLRGGLPKPSQSLLPPVTRWHKLHHIGLSRALCRRTRHTGLKSLCPFGLWDCFHILWRGTINAKLGMHQSNETSAAFHNLTQAIMNILQQLFALSCRLKGHPFTQNCFQNCLQLIIALWGRRDQMQEVVVDGAADKATTKGLMKKVTGLSGMTVCMLSKANTLNCRWFRQSLAAH